MNKLPNRRLALLILLLLVCACTQRELKPVPILAEDMCDYCRMAISEKRYAAEILDPDGQAFKFDEIGCMLHYLKQNKSAVAAYFVADFDNRQWLKAEEAHIVRSPKFKTPMGGSMAAFQDPSRAEAAAREFEGQLLNFSEL